MFEEINLELEIENNNVQKKYFGDFTLLEFFSAYRIFPKDFLNYVDIVHHIDLQFLTFINDGLEAVTNL